MLSIRVSAALADSWTIGKLSNCPPRTWNPYLRLRQQPVCGMIFP